MKSAAYIVITIITVSIYAGLSGKLFAQGDQDFQMIIDLPYYDSKAQSSDKQKLNLVLPKHTDNVPLLIWIGGGAWSYVDRNMEMNLARKLAKEGIAVAAVGHRLSPALWKDSSLSQGIQHPEHIKDVAMAFKWLYEHAPEYGYSRNNMFIAGYSSGGHLAALLSMDGRYLDQHGLSKEHIKGVIPIAGTYDISHYYQLLSGTNGRQMADSHVKGVFGESEKEFTDASPATYVRSMTVPMLLISEINTYRYTSLFEEKIKQSGFSKLEVVHIKELDHGGLWKNLSFEAHSKYRNLIRSFIKTHTTL